MRVLTITFLTLPLLVSAQFGSFFDQMFHGDRDHGHHGHRRERQNVPSDAAWYRQTYDGAACDKYLCPGTLACVDKPTHCPCSFDEVEDKIELHADGLAVCLSRKAKGVNRAEMVEAMRKGYL